MRELPSALALAKPLLPAALKSGGAGHVIGIEPLGMQQSGALEFHLWDTLLTGDATAVQSRDGGGKA